MHLRSYFMKLSPKTSILTSLPFLNSNSSFICTVRMMVPASRKRLQLPRDKPLRYVEYSQKYPVLVPGICKCYLIWVTGLCRGEVKDFEMKRVPRIIQEDSECLHKCLHKERSKGRLHTGEKVMWRQRQRCCDAAPNQGMLTARVTAGGIALLTMTSASGLQDCCFKPLSLWLLVTVHSYLEYTSFYFLHLLYTDFLFNIIACPICLFFYIF